MRLNRYLARAGRSSRRGADRLILDGRVRVNGRVVTNLATTVDPKSDLVELDGLPVVLPARLTYIAFNKPRGCVVTMSDPQGRTTVSDLLGDAPPGVVPVGRLDADTEGLLILTDDGDLAHRIAHPSFELDKVYEVEARGVMSEQERLSLEQGVEIDGRRTAPALVNVLSTEGGRTLAVITIHEGRKRQVRRMFDHVGHRVERLTRVRVGPVELGELRSGTWRNLASDELEALRKALEPTNE